jgi:hypothetical protein
MSEREAWQQGYDQGVLDARDADALQVGVGLSVPAQPHRQNPYEHSLGGCVPSEGQLASARAALALFRAGPTTLNLGTGSEPSNG